MEKEKNESGRTEKTVRRENAAAEALPEAVTTGPASGGRVEGAAPAAAPRKKPGRKPMTEEQKAEARRLREAARTDAAKATAYIQFGGAEVCVDDLVEAARADYKLTHRRTPVESIKLYLKPEENAAYYVVNESGFGKVDM